MMYTKIALITLLLAGCSTAGLVPDATCDALDQYLPTWGTDDTEETLESAGRFLDVYVAVCY